MSPSLSLLDIIIPDVGECVLALFVNRSCITPKICQQHLKHAQNSFRSLKSPQLASVIYLKNQTRIQALNMLLTFSLLLRALIQYRLREGLKTFKEEHPNEEIYAGWAGRPLKNPTFKLLYEHSINCCFERECMGKYSFSWLSLDTRERVEPLLRLMNLSLELLLQ